MFSLNKDKIDDVYASLKEHLNIEYGRELNKYLIIELDLRPYISIHLMKHNLSQRIINMIPVMEKSSAKPNPAFTPHPAKHEG